MVHKKPTTARFYDVLEVKTGDVHTHAYKPHLHSELSIGVIERGETVLTIDGQDYHFKEGEAIIIMPYVVHNCQPVDINNWAFTMIYLDNAYKDGLMKTLSPNMQIGISKLSKNEYALIKNLSQALQSENDPFSEEVQIIDCLNMIVESIELKLEKEISKNIASIHQYIGEHFLEDIRLEKLENLFNIDRFKLIRRFKASYNCTPSAYQLQLKVDYSKRLMKKQTTLSDIALDAGFYDQAHFTREFKKSTGMTPNYYLKSINDSKSGKDT